MDLEAIQRAREIAEASGLGGPLDFTPSGTESASAWVTRLRERVHPDYGKPRTRNPLRAFAGGVGSRGTVTGDILEATGIKDAMRRSGRPLPDEYVPEGFFAEVAHGVGSLTGRLPYYSGAGKIVGGPARAVGGYLATRGISPRVARTAQRMLAGSGTFGLGDVASETVAQGVGIARGREDFRPGEIARAGGQGMAIGAVLGPAQAIRSAPKRFISEVAGLTGVGSAIEGKMPTLEVVLHNAAFIGVLHSAKILRKNERAITGEPDRAGAIKSMIAGFKSRSVEKVVRLESEHRALLNELQTTIPDERQATEIERRMNEIRDEIVKLGQEPSEAEPREPQTIQARPEDLEGFREKEPLAALDVRIGAAERKEAAIMDLAEARPDDSGLARRLEVAGEGLRALDAQASPLRTTRATVGQARIQGGSRPVAESWADDVIALKTTREGGPGRSAARRHAGTAGLKGPELQEAIAKGDQLGWSQRQLRNMPTRMLAEVVESGITPARAPQLAARLQKGGPSGMGVPPGVTPRATVTTGRVTFPKVSTPPREEPTKAEFDREAKKVEPEPTPAQIEADNYKKGHVRWQGMDVAIETAKGGVRKGPGWEVRNFPSHYGDLKGTEGRDGDALDVFVGPKPESGKVWLIDQRSLKTGKFDEHKAMIGFESKEHALDTYARAYEKGMSEKLIGSVSELPVERFKKWATGKGRRTRPFSTKFKARGAGKTFDGLPETLKKGKVRRAPPGAIDRLRQAKKRIEEPEKTERRDYMAGDRVKVARRVRYIQDVEVRDGVRWYRIGNTKARKSRTGLRWVPERFVSEAGPIKVKAPKKKAHAPMPEHPDSDRIGMMKWIRDEGGINFGEESRMIEEPGLGAVGIHQKGGMSKDGLADLLQNEHPANKSESQWREWIEDVLLGGGEGGGVGIRRGIIEGWPEAESVLKKIRKEFGDDPADMLRREMNEYQDYVPRFDAERYAKDKLAELRTEGPNLYESLWAGEKRIPAKMPTERPSMEEAAAAIEQARRTREQAEADNLKVEGQRERDQGRGQERMFDPELDRRIAEEEAIQAKEAAEARRQASLIPEATENFLTENMERSAPGPKPSKADLLEDAERNLKPEGPDSSTDPDNSLGAASARDFRKPTVSVRDLKNAVNEYKVQYPTPGKPVAMTPEQVKQVEQQMGVAQRMFGKSATKNFQEYLDQSRELTAKEAGRQQALKRQVDGKATIADIKTTAVKIPKEGRAPSDTERSILARGGEWRPKAVAQLGRTGAFDTKESFDKLPREHRLVHLVRRLRGAGHPKEIDAIMAAEKYGTADMAREDLQALLTVVGERYRGLKEAEAAPEAKALGKTEYIFGWLPARSALRAIGEDILGPPDSPKWKIAHGILEHPQLGMRANQVMFREESNLQVHQAEALIFRDAKGKPFAGKTRESAIIHALTDNWEGDAKWIDRKTVTMPDTDPYHRKPLWTEGEKIEVQEHHRQASRKWSEVMLDLADRQGLAEEMRREFYAPHTGPSKFLGRILDLEPATAKDRANIHNAAKKNLGEGETVSADLLNGILPENLSRAAAMQIRDSLVGRPVKTIKGLRGRLKAVLVMADIESVPKQIRQPHFKKRKGAPWVSDAVTAHEQYLRYSLRKIHLEPALEAILPVLETLGESKGFGTGVGRVSRRAYAEEWLKQNVGKPTYTDQRVDAWTQHMAMRYPRASNFPVIRHLFTGRLATRAAHAVNRYQYYRLLGFAIDSALTNMTQGVNNLATFGMSRTLGAYGRLLLNPRNVKFLLPFTKKTLRYKGKTFEFDPEQEFREFFTGPDPRLWVQKPFTALERIALSPFTLIEYLNRGSSYLAALSEAQAKGLSFEQAVRLGKGAGSKFLEKHFPEEARKAFFTSEAEWHARARVMETQFGYSVVESSPIFRSPVRKVALQFFSYPSQQAALLMDGIRGKVEPTAYARMRFLALIGFTAFVGNYLSEKLLGVDVSNIFSIRGVVPRGLGPNAKLALMLWGALFGDWQDQARLKREYGTPKTSPIDLPLTGTWVPRAVRKATGITHRSLDEEAGIYRVLPVRPVREEEAPSPRRRRRRRRPKRPKRERR